MFGLSLSVAPALAQPPLHEWSDRQPDLNPPALNDTAVGSGTNGTHIFSVYERDEGPGASNFRLVKYDTSGSKLAETQWPENDIAGKFAPRAMKVVHTEDFPPRTDIFITGDIPEVNPAGRRIVVLCFDENLKMRWMWTHIADDDGPPDEQAVALDASPTYAAIVGRVGQRYMTVVFNRYGTSSIAMPPQYAQPTDPDNWPVAVSLTGATNDEVVAIVGGPRWHDPGSGSGPLHAIQYTVSLNPTFYQWVTGFQRTVPSAIRTTGGRLYVTGYGYNTQYYSRWDIFFGIHDIGTGLDWWDSYIGPNSLDNIVNSLEVFPGVAPPASQGSGWDAFVWITGGHVNADGSQDAVTIQYRDLGIECDPVDPTECWLAAQRDWTAAYSNHAGGRAEGVFVTPRSDFTGGNNDLVYVNGVVREGESNRLDVLLLQYTAERISGNKPFVWDVKHPSHAGDIDWPVSFVEHPDLGGPAVRRLVIGLQSMHPTTHQDMVTSQWCDSPLCRP